MKKAVLILILLVLSVLYYLGVLTKKETFPFSKEFFSTETSVLSDQLIDLKGLRASNLKELDALYQQKLDQGIRNIPLLSLLLIRQSRESRKAGDADQCVRWANYSVRFSPDLPEPYFNLARALWYQNPLQVLKPLSEVWKGLLAYFGYYPRALRFFYNVFYIFGNALLMTFIVFAMVGLVKYLPLYFYDIYKNLTQEVGKLLANSFKIFILFVPFFLRLDLLWALLFYLILLWGFVTKRERQFIVFFFVVVVYLPFFLRSASAFLDGPASAILMEMNEANYEAGGSDVRQHLKNWLTTHPDDAEVFFTLGLMEKRQGHYDQAQDYYRKARQLSPPFSEACSNLGNIYFARKQTDLAIASYQQAVELDPSRAAYWFNLYRAYSQETFLSMKKDPAFQKARQLDPKLVEYYASIDTPPHPNRLVVDEVLDPKALWTRFLNQFVGREGFLFHLFKAWFEKIPSRLFFLVPLFFLGFWVGMSKYGRTRRFLTRCPVCGNPTHRFYLGNTDQEYICFNCYRIYIQKEKLHPKITEKKTVQVQRFQKENDFIQRFLSFFFLGFRDLWRDHAFKGLCLLFVFFVFILRFVYWNGVIPSSFGQPFSSPWKWILWVGLFGLYYYAAVRPVLRPGSRPDSKRGSVATR